MIDNNMMYDETRLFRAVKTEEPAGWIEQDELCWQSQYYDEFSANDDGWERGSYYATPEDAIEGARQGKQMADTFSSFFS